MYQIKKMYQLLFLSLVVLFVTACSQTNKNYTFLHKEKSLILKDGIEVKFSNDVKYKDRFAGCVMDSYTILDEKSNYGKLFLESISLDNQCIWQGLPLSLFEKNLKREIRFNSFETVENITLKNYIFRTYKIDGEYLSLIYITSFGSDRMILDYEGKLYTKLAEQFGYNSKYSDKKRFSKTYNDSLAEKNIVYHYFQRDKADNL